MVFALLILVVVLGLVGYGTYYSSRSLDPGPEPVSCDDRIEKLERWNANWSHPELEGDFYHWDETEKKFVEGKGKPKLNPSKPQAPPMCRCDRLPEGMTCSICFFKNRS